MMFVVDPEDINRTGNGDICIRTRKGALVALIYANARSSEYANAIVTALNAAFAPSHTDVMVSPESLDAWLEANPLPVDGAAS